MCRKPLLCFVGLLFIPVLLFAQTIGKVSGKVTDRETGEALIGANVIVEGTNLGATTDLNGDYVILNVPVGTCTLVCSYVGYTNVTVHTVIVNGGLTTELNFQLPSTAVQVQPLELIAEKPLINKSATNAVRIIRGEGIQRMAVRGVRNIISLQAGIVSQGGNFYVHGGRSDETAYYIDGVRVNNPMFGGGAIWVIDNAVEEIQVQAGGYNAEYGGAISGIISTVTKTGTSDLHASLELITDNWGGETRLEREYLGPHNVRVYPSRTSRKILDTYSYGYSEYVLTLSGPIISGDLNYKFFIVADQTFNRSTASFWKGLNFQNVTDPTEMDTISVEYPGGRLADGYDRRWTINGNMSADVGPFSLRLTGTWSRCQNKGSVGTTNVLASARTPLYVGYNASASLRVSHQISPTTYYSVSLNYLDLFDKQMDPDLQDYWFAYGDSIENAKYGYTLRGNSWYPYPYNVFGFKFTNPNSQQTGYYKSRQSSIGVTADFVHQIGRTHEIKFGGEYTLYTLRQYNQPSAFAAKDIFATSPTRENPAVLALALRSDIFGYDFWGNEIDNEIPYIDTTGAVGAAFAAPARPLIAAAYVQDKIDFDDLVVNVGLRYDYIESGGKEFDDPFHLGMIYPEFLERNQIKDVSASSTVSPRIGVTFAASERTAFHAQYGEFVQQSRFRDIFKGFTPLARDIFGGYAIVNPIGWGLRPERSTQYELGLTQMLGTNASFDITLYYKDIVDQTYFSMIPSNPTSYFTWLNGGFSTIKGFELKLDLHRTQRVEVDATYAFSDARGAVISAWSAFSILYDRGMSAYTPPFLAPLAFDQRHRGAINCDYRFAEDDGPTVLGAKIFERSGLNLLFTFNSGHPYTRVNPNNHNVPVEEINTSETPWNYQLDMKLNKMVKIGPLDVDFYVYVINLVNSENPQEVFSATGNSQEDGYLGSALGKAKIKLFGESYVQMYRQLNLENVNLGVPRQIRFGLRINY